MPPALRPTYASLDAALRLLRSPPVLAAALRHADAPSVLGDAALRVFDGWRAPAAALAVARRLVADGGACAGGSAGGALLREGCRRLPAAHGWLALALAPFVEAHADGRGGGGLAPLLARLRRHAPALREIRRLAAAARASGGLAAAAALLVDGWLAPALAAARVRRRRALARAAGRAGRRARGARR